MKQYIFSAVCLMSGVLCMSSCNEDKQAKPYTPDYEIVPEYTNADTWTAYEAFNDNLLDPDKNIYKTSTAYTAATDRNNGAAAIWCQPIYWDMAMNAYKRAKAEGDTERENKYKQLCDDLFAGNKAHYVNFDFDVIMRIPAGLSMMIYSGGPLLWHVLTNYLKWKSIAVWQKQVLHVYGTVLPA